MVAICLYNVPDLTHSQSGVIPKAFGKLVPVVRGLLHRQIQVLTVNSHKIRKNYKKADACTGIFVVLSVAKHKKALKLIFARFPWDVFRETKPITKHEKAFFAKIKEPKIEDALNKVRVAHWPLQRKTLVWLIRKKQFFWIDWMNRVRLKIG